MRGPIDSKSRRVCPKWLHTLETLHISEPADVQRTTIRKAGSPQTRSMPTRSHTTWQWHLHVSLVGPPHFTFNRGASTGPHGCLASLPCHIPKRAQHQRVPTCLHIAATRPCANTTTGTVPAISLSSSRRTRGLHGRASRLRSRPLAYRLQGSGGYNSRTHHLPVHRALRCPSPAQISSLMLSYRIDPAVSDHW